MSVSTETHGQLSGDGARDMSGVRDFDFLHGRWNVLHKTRMGRLCGCEEWAEASAIDIVRPAFAGLGNIGRFMRVFDGEHYEGVPIRLYDPRDGMWRIYWLDNLDQRLEPAVIGRFEQNCGVFEGDDRLRGSPIKVRFIWSDITSTAARWEQSFSNDNGRSWEVNSIMEFARNNRLPENPQFPLPI